MPTTADQNPSTESGEQAPGQGAEPRWALSLGHVALFAFLTFWFLLLSYLPLDGTWKLWGQVIYGEWILEHGSLPAADPVMPLSEGMRVVDSAWLSQVILASVERRGGADWLSQLFALTGLAIWLILAWTLLRASRSTLATFFGVLAALAISWFSATTFGAESFGVLCLAILLWLITTGTAGKTRRLWLGLPPLFVAWANLDGSYLYGLAVLGCCALGRAIDAFRRTRRLRSVLDDRAARRWLYLFELAAAVTLLNPYGIDLVLYLFGVAVTRPPGTRLTLWGASGLAFGLSWVVLLVVLRLSRRPLPSAHVLLLAVFGAAGASGVGRLAWYGPVFALVLVPHLAEIRGRFRSSPAEPEPEPPSESEAESEEDYGRPRLTAGPSWHYTVVCAMLTFIALMLSPVGGSLKGRLPRTLGQLVGPTTPLALASHLAASPPRGQIFNPMHWGHWLALHGPPGLETFVTNDSHLIPRQVWGGYLRLVDAGYEYQEILGLYDVETVILDRVRHGRLANAMRAAEGWNLTYGDNLALIFVRAPIAGEAAAEASPAAGPPVASPAGEQP